MEALLESMSRGIQAGPGVALLFAFLWGVLSVLLSPCHLASIPLILGFLSGEGRSTSRRAFAIATSFALGILLSIAVIGWLTATFGRMLGDLGPWANYLVALVFFVFGLNLAGIIPLNFAGVERFDPRFRGVGPALILGAIFGLALGPCTFAYMAPVLAAAVRVASYSSLYSMALLGAFGVGHCAVIAGAGVSTHQVQQLLQWNQGSRALDYLKQLCGLLVILAGLYLIYTA